jgi:hypothetical protein
VRVLGRAPLGRWGRLEIGPALPRFDQVLAADRPVPARRFRDPRGGAWAPLSRRVEKRPSLGPAVELDFGEVVTGYAQLSIRGPAGTSGVLEASETEADDALVRADAVVTTLHHRGLWQDAVPRRFRYLRVWGLDGIHGAAVLPVTADGFARLAPPAAAPGLLAIESPPLRAPVEDVVRRQLESTAGVGVGEGR